MPFLEYASDLPRLTLAVIGRGRGGSRLGKLRSGAQPRAPG